MKKKKIFISYSWSPKENASWVRELARRLISNGVHVILDIWDLSEGQDKYVFMEKMVSDEDIDKVLLICNESYASKANLRKGGVGDESLIITPKVYKDVNQKKFIPIVTERDKLGQPFLPNYIASRLYVDLSEGDSFEDNYEKLIRLIYDKPAEKRPPLGTVPAYVLEDDVVHIKTYYLLKPIKNALKKDSDSALSLISDYYIQFLEALDDFVVETRSDYDTSNKELDNLYYSEIEKMHDLIEGYKDFLDAIIRYPKYFDIEELKSFLEKFLEYHLRYKDKGFEKGITRLTGSHISFIRYELFLNTIMLMLKAELFERVGFLLSTPYYVKRSTHDKIRPYYFNLFYFPAFLFEYRNKTKDLRRVNLRADLIKSRARDAREFVLLQEVDAILFYRSLLDSVKPISFYNEGYSFWHPDLSVYYVNEMPNLEKLISTKYFNKFKEVLGVNSKEELFSFIDQLGEKTTGGVRLFHYNIPSIKKILRGEDISKYP